MNNTVNFEIAKLLKEKGFKANVKNLIYNESGELLDSIEQLNLMKEEESLQDYFKLIKSFPNAPTIAEVIMWLYETHSIWIEITKSTDIFNINRICTYNVDEDINMNADLDGLDFKDFSLPQEAYSAAIEYVLTKFI